MAISFLDNITLNDLQLQNVVLQKLGSDPTGVEGKIIYNTGTNTVKYYNGSAWIELDGLGGITGSGTVGTVPKFVTNTTTLGDSPITISGTRADFSGGIRLSAGNIDTSQTSGSFLAINKGLADKDGQLGTSGQLLSSTGTQVDWIDAPVSYTKWIAVNQDVYDGNTYQIDESSTRPGIVSEAVTKSGTTITQPLALFTKNMSLTSPGDYATDVMLWGKDTSATSWKVNKTKFTDVTISTWAAAEADVSFDGFKLTSLGNPSASTDAANKAYVDSAVVGNLVFQGGYNAATNTPDLDSSPSASIKKGWSYVVTAAGSFFTETVEVGDFIIAQQDAPTTLANWVTVQNNTALATASTVGIGNVNVSGPGDLDGLALSYSSGTATVGVDIKNNVTAFTAIGEMQFLVYDGGDTGDNLALPIEAISTYVNDVNSFAGSNTSSGTSHAFVHNLGTTDVIVQLFDVSTNETVYATTDRTSTTKVTVTTASSIASGAIRALITKVK